MTLMPLDATPFDAFRAVVPATDDLQGAPPRWRPGDDPDFWACLREHPMPLAGLVYPEPAHTLPPATGAIVVGEIVTAAVEPRRAPRKRTKGPGLAVSA